MKRSAEILVHFFFWIAFVALTWILTRVYLKADPDAPFSNHLGYVIFLEWIMGLLFFYITFFGIRWAGKRKGRFAILAITLICLLVFFAYPALSHGVIPVVSSLIPHIVLVFLALIFRKYSDVLRMENDKKELLFQNVQSELALLKMQLSPHFLFNTLNNIDFLIHQNARKASDSISKLGTILRYMIYEADAEKINLSKEIKHTEDYIELLRLRVLNPDYRLYQVAESGRHGYQTEHRLYFRQIRIQTGQNNDPGYPVSGGDEGFSINCYQSGQDSSGSFPG